jgi:hypothetical protein
VAHAPHGDGPETRDKREETDEAHDDHVDLARGIAIGIVVGILMWGLAALIVWAMFRG